MGIKTCKKCLVEKPLSLFYNNRSAKDNKAPYCKECDKARHKKAYHKDVESSRRKLSRAYEKRKAQGKNKAYYQTNKSKIAVNVKQYYENNKEKCLQYAKEYYQSNRDSVNNYRNQYALLRSKSDINYLLRLRLRSRLSCAVNNNQKAGSAISDLGCSIEELKIHIESKFQDGMSWNNYGIDGWHIDHIKPLASFDLSCAIELKKACHYSNLQPLWAKDNLSKGAKIER